MRNSDNVHDATQTSSRAAVPSRLTTAWAQASGRAFAAALSDPQAYQRTARLVGALAEALAHREVGQALLEREWDRRDALLHDVVDADPLLTLDGVDQDAALGAAFALCHTATLDKAAMQDRAAMMAIPADQDAWLVLEERGYAPGDPFVPYHRLEAQPASCRALLVTTQPDESMARCVHVVQELVIEPTTGRLAMPPSSHDTTFGDAEDREHFVSALRAPGGEGTGTTEDSFPTPT